MEQRSRAAEQGVALRRPYRPEVGNVDAIDVRLYGIAEVRLVLDAAGDDQGQPRPFGDLDRDVRSLVGVDPVEEEQVFPGIGHERELARVDAVMDRGGIVQIRLAVGVADRDVTGDVVIGAIDGQSLPRWGPVDRRDHRRGHQAAIAQRQEVEMVGQHVELACSFEGRRVVQGFACSGVGLFVFLVADRNGAM